MSYLRFLGLMGTPINGKNYINMMGIYVITGPGWPRLESTVMR